MQLIAAVAAVVDVLVVASGSSHGSTVSMHHSIGLGERSAGVASWATAQQGRGADAVSLMAYSTPTQSQTFSKVVTTS